MNKNAIVSDTFAQTQFALVPFKNKERVSGCAATICIKASALQTRLDAGVLNCAGGVNNG